ncbi:MAG: cyclase family protein [Blastocatellia bacterium]
MRCYDVTVAVSESMPIYEGDPKVKIDAFMSMKNGGAANVSHACFGAHTGTHVDAPNHFIDGTRRVDELDLDKLVGNCRVIEIEANVAAIGQQHLGDLNCVERVIFKTRNSAFWNEPEKGFRTDFTHLTLDAARIIADRGMKLVGIDYLSIEAFGSPDHAVHITLLEKEVVILEGVDLRGVTAGDYELICLPLKYIGGMGDGAPARTLLREIV